VLTHAHEDHIGALPYFAGELGVPLYATPFTADLVHAQAGRSRASPTGRAERGRGRSRPFQIGPFTITYLPLAHSIPRGTLC
jgi:ribonuclease J